MDFPRVDPRWAFETGAEIGYTGAVFVDKDGSIGGKPGSYVVIDNGIASDDKTCTIEKSWGAAICQGDFGRLSLRASDGKPPPARPTLRPDQRRRADHPHPQWQDVHHRQRRRVRRRGQWQHHRAERRGDQGGDRKLGPGTLAWLRWTRAPS
ncbi:MAG: hypothetical protein WDN45_02240 [Caulobacteraceae bacterium]